MDAMTSTIGRCVRKTLGNRKARRKGTPLDYGLNESLASLLPGF